MTIRTPRTIKRYPRPFRFSRLRPTKCCHCVAGRMVVLGANTVKCTKCKFLVGSESFPNRIKRASAMLKRAEETGTLPRLRNRKAVSKKTGGASKPVNRPKKRATTPSVQDRKKKKAQQKGKGVLVVRSTGGKEETHGTATPAEPAAAVPTGESTTVPEAQNPAIPASEETTKSLVVEDTTMDQIVKAGEESVPEIPKEEEHKG